MKAITSIDELTAALRQIQLLTPQQFEQYERDAKAQFQDVKRLSSLLVERGFLTRYQVDSILKFEGAKLVLGNYVIVDKLGEGGMGVVYKAWQRRLNRFVAIKTIREHVSKNEERLVKRFRREAELAAQLLHPNIVVVHDLDQDGDTHFIVMEYVEGVDLARHVHDVGPLAVAHACDYIRQAAIGLQHAHEHGLIHRDIKPSNLLLAAANKSSSVFRRSMSGMDQPALLQGTTHGIERLQPTRIGPTANSNRLPGSGTGVIKLLDLGLACLNGSFQETGQSSLTVKGSFLGTPDYVAPEQGRNASSVDGRADLYSLGCTLFFLLTGQPPFADGSSIDKLMRHQYDSPPKLDTLRPETPSSIRRIVKKLMAKKPEDRYQTAQELADALYEAQQEMDSAVKPPPTPAATPEPAPDSDSAHTPAKAVRASKPRHASPTIEESATNFGTAAQKSSSIKAHQGCVLSLAFSADSKLLASSGVDDTLRIWELGETPSERGTIRGVSIGEAHALCFSPDGRYLFGGATNTSGYMFRCNWMMPGPDKFHVFRGPENPIAAIAVATDGEHMISAGGKSVVLWNMDQKKLRQRTEMEGHRADFKSAAVAGDNKLLAAGDNDGVVWVWRIGRLWTKPVNVFVGHHGSVNTVAFSPDSKEVASGGLDKRVLIWDACGSSENPSEIYDGLNSHVRQIVFLDGGTKLLAAGQDGHCLIWDRKTRSPQFQMSLAQVFAVQVAVSPDGQTLAVALNDGTISFYRIDSARTAAGAMPPMASNRTKTSKTDSSEQTKRTRVVPAKAADAK